MCVGIAAIEVDTGVTLQPLSRRLSYSLVGSLGYNKLMQGSHDLVLLTVGNTMHFTPGYQCHTSV